LLDQVSGENHPQTCVALHRCRGNNNEQQLTAQEGGRVRRRRTRRRTAEEDKRDDGEEKRNIIKLKTPPPRTLGREMKVRETLHLYTHIYINVYACTGGSHNTGSHGPSLVNLLYIYVYFTVYKSLHS